jgi:multisubunit Na+/H+ antiporter MnhE subunit
VTDFMTEPGTVPSLKDRILKEAALFGALLLAGLVVLPLLIYLVGEAVFGAYEGAGFSDFYSRLHGEFRAGEPAVLFLLLAPYILWQLLRATARVFRQLRGASGSPG